jgi:hypothetical protein
MRGRVWKDTDGLWLWQLVVEPSCPHETQMRISGSRHSWREAYDQVWREIGYVSEDEPSRAERWGITEDDLNEAGC